MKAPPSRVWSEGGVVVGWRVETPLTHVWGESGAGSVKSNWSVVLIAVDMVIFVRLPSPSRRAGRCLVVVAPCVGVAAWLCSCSWSWFSPSSSSSLRSWSLSSTGKVVVVVVTTCGLVRRSDDCEKQFQ